MAWYGPNFKVEKKKSKNQPSVEELLEKAKENFIKFLSDPRKNKRGMEANLDEIKIEKRPYTRKDGKKSYLLIAKIPVRFPDGTQETREYIFNRGYFTKPRY